MAYGGQAQIWKSRTLEDLITVHNFKVCQLAFGDSHCIFITSSGHVYGYGDGDKGQLGTGNEDNHTKEPVQVLLPQCKVEDPCSNCAVIHIACGPYHSAAVLKNGSVYMWGSSDSGQCGIEMPAVLNPHHIKFEESYDDNDDMKSTQMYCHHNDPNQVFIIAISCGAEHTVALSSKHEVWVWGKGSAQLGLISVLWSCKPMKVPFLHQKTVLSVSCGLNHTAILVQKTNISTQDDDHLDSCKQCELDQKQNNEELNESRVCPLGLPVSSLLASPVASSEILLDDENPLTESLEELPRPDHADVELGMNSLVLDDTLSCTETIQEKIIEAMVSSQSLTETGNMEISEGTDDVIENNACVGKENYFEESELPSLSIVDEQSAKAFLSKQLDTNNDNVLKKKSLKDSLLSSTTNAVSELYNSVNEKLEMLVQMQASPGIKLSDEIVKFSDLTKVTEPMIDQEQFSEEFCTKSSSLKSLDESGIFKMFMKKVVVALLKLTRHSFTTKSQSAYIKDLKSSMKPLEEIILKGDFAENYLYVVQDEIQSFHWENKQATLHQFVAYRKLEDGTLEHRNICVVSDVKEHSTSTVYAFQQVVLDYLKNEFPEIKKVHYFTDGCAGQYKNKHNFINLCCHQKDFGLEAEWNFFATSHGKSACDGIGGTVKRLLTKARIKFFNVPPKDVKKFNTDLRNRFEISTTIKGTHQFHRFVPLSPTHLSVYKLSAQVDLPVVVAITALAEQDNISEVPLDIAEQNYVCCLYDNEPWIGLVEDISDEHGDYHIKFMHPHGPAKLFRWPRDEDRCWIDKKSIFCVIDTPSLAISTQMYNISKHDTAKITGLCKGRNGQLGHGDMLERMQPCMVQSLANKNVMKVVAAGNHTAVMTSDSRIFTWGSNSCGQLGHSFSVSSVCSPTKIQLSGSTLVWDIAANVNCTTFLADGYGKQVGIFSCGEKSQEKSGECFDPSSVQPRHLNTLKKGTNICRIYGGGRYSGYICDIDSSASFKLLHEFAVCEKHFSNSLQMISEEILRPLLHNDLMSTESNCIMALKLLIGVHTELCDAAAINCFDLIQLFQEGSTVFTNNEILNIFMLGEVEEYLTLARRYINLFCDCIAVGAIFYIVKTLSAFVDQVHPVLNELYQITSTNNTKSANPADILIHLLELPCKHILNYGNYLSKLASQYKKEYPEKSMLENLSIDYLDCSTYFKNQREKAMVTQKFWESSPYKVAEYLKERERRFIKDGKSHPLTLNAASRFSSHWFILFNDVFIHSQDGSTWHEKTRIQCNQEKVYFQLLTCLSLQYLVWTFFKRWEIDFRNGILKMDDGITLSMEAEQLPNGIVMSKSKEVQKGSLNDSVNEVLDKDGLTSEWFIELAMVNGNGPVKQEDLNDEIDEDPGRSIVLNEERVLDKQQHVRVDTHLGKFDSLFSQDNRNSIGFSGVHAYYLTTMWIDIIPDSEVHINSFSITTPEEILILSCPSPQLKTEWICALNQGIKNALSNSSQSKGHRLSPPLARYSQHTFCKAAPFKDATYTGMWLCGKLHGEGELEWPNRKKYVGKFKQNLQHGHGILTIPSDMGNSCFTVYEGEWKNGQLNGLGTVKYPNGDIYEGYFKDGMRDGHGVLKKGQFLSTAASVYIGQWTDNCRHGYGVNDDVMAGEKYLGWWENDGHHGNGVVVTIDGVYYEGSFYQNKMQGYGLVIFEDNTSYEGDLSGHCVFNGKGTLNLSNGDYIEGNFSGKWNEGVKVNGTYFKSTNNASFHTYPVKNLPKNDQHIEMPIYGPPLLICAAIGQSVYHKFV
ncbi:Alsin [Nymphon striatum]|nr:Alsin [Nymphon striatum]